MGQITTEIEYDDNKLYSRMNWIYIECRCHTFVHFIKYVQSSVI